MEFLIEYGVAHAFLADGLLYSILCTMSLMQLIRNCWHYQPLTVQKMIHAFMFLGTFTRSIFLLLVSQDWCDALTGFIQPSTCSRTEKEIFYIMDELPMVMYLAVYTLIVQFWSEVYLNAINRVNVVQQYVRPAIYMWIMSVLTGQVIVWILFGTVLQREHAFVPVSQASVNLIMFVIITSVFVYLGRKVYLELRAVPFDTAIRLGKMKELVVMTSICSVGFLSRCFLELYMAREKQQLQEKAAWLLIIFYYGVLEWIPSITILYYNRNIPKHERHTIRNYTSIMERYNARTAPNTKYSELHEGLMSEGGRNSY